MKANEISRAALQLSPAQRKKLARMLWESVEREARRPALQ